MYYTQSKRDHSLSWNKNATEMNTYQISFHFLPKANWFIQFVYSFNKYLWSAENTGADDSGVTRHDTDTSLRAYTQVGKFTFKILMETCVSNQDGVTGTRSTLPPDVTKKEKQISYVKQWFSQHWTSGSGRQWPRGMEDKLESSVTASPTALEDCPDAQGGQPRQNPRDFGVQDTELGPWGDQGT